MSADEGWTRVHHKSRRKPPPSPSVGANHDQPPDSFAPRTTGLLRPADALRADYDKVRAEWLASPAHAALLRIVDEQQAGPRRTRVRRAVCLGIGTFDPEDGAWQSKRAAKRSIECIVQEPILTHADEAFLTSLGHRIVTSPAAYTLIDDTTLLFAVHLYRPVYAAALQSSLPAAFIGTGWDVWETAIMDKATDLENMKKMHQTYTRYSFPQDTASTAFSSTSIYWRPPDGVQAAASEADGDDGSVQEISVVQELSLKDSTALERDTIETFTSTATDKTTGDDTGTGENEVEKLSIHRI
ncbi:hypothetical protein A9K55_000021 [Cordyceps militaris]|uniref:SRR1-like domain-containing protein n=1 Tax=Cordyceps militaris TaxID=73501 RepID=A0A2H4SW02_CORMI|nr:hypothetical protein A9K55_000021 [Cordyceps militaris]